MKKGEQNPSRNIKHDVDIHLLMERGRRIRIGPRDRPWEAVYWGSDDGGDILASLEQGHWRFVHYNLKEVSGQVQVGDLMSVSEIHALEKDALKGMERSDA